MATSVFQHLSNLKQVEDCALDILAAEAYPSFVQSKACLPLVDTLLSISDVPGEIKELTWSDYTIPSDTAGWIRSFVSVAEMFPACIVLSDMAMAGNPMFFVNREFCRITGYSKAECHGRNCRFLQGPKTEPEAVAYIQDTLRRGVDCHVKLTNYRKDGEMFQNLLSMRPVHDSNGVYRFCIGVQFSVSSEASRLLALLEQLLQLLPSTIKVPYSKPVGHVHQKQEAQKEKSTQVVTKLESALAGTPIHQAPESSAYKASADFGQNHAAHLRDLGITLERCAHVDLLARELRCQKPSAGPWFQMLTDVLEHTPHAMLAVDMLMPGLPMAFANPAMCTLTGYSKEELEGHNCRMLQGEKTEADAVAKMVDAIRGGVQTTLSDMPLTNYRKDGSEFVNVLTLHPVRDSTGVYRYCLGVLCDRKDYVYERERVAQLCQLLPSTFNVALQNQRKRQGTAVSNDEEQRKQWTSSLAQFTRLVWSLDWEASLRQIVSRADCFPALSRWFAERAPEQAAFLELVLVVAELEKSVDTRGLKAIELASVYLDEQHSNGVEALAALHENVSVALSALAANAFPKFVRSAASLGVIQTLMTVQELTPSRELIWSSYTVPEDVAGWIHSFVSIAEGMHACIVVSDMAVPGNPMVFVNREFCTTTGYLREEAHGRNCRFLQGPKTEPASVATIQDTLRRGVDCIVRMTNYRKSGELFINLLTMRPVHDSNGVYRYCIGVQFEVVDDWVRGGAQHSCKRQLDKLVALVKELPSTIEVTGPPVGPVHHPVHTAEERSTELAERFEKVLAQPVRQNVDSGDSIVTLTPKSYGRNHAIQMRSIGFRPERCDRVDKLASAFGVTAPYPGPWLQMLTDVLEHLPNAMTVVDMQEPGLPMAFANPAMCTLTGYSKEELEGHNCRMLQGEKTEADAVAKMVDAIRRAVPTIVRLHNYRKDGSEFVNVLTLHPVRDSTGVYRYCLGVLCQPEQAEQESLGKLRANLMSEFDASLPDRAGSIKPADPARLSYEQRAGQRRRWVRSLAPLTKAGWAIDCQRSLRQLCGRRVDAMFLVRWLSQGGGASQDTQLVEGLVQISERLVYQGGVYNIPESAEPSSTIDLCREVIGKLVVSDEAAVAKLSEWASSTISMLAPKYQEFVRASNASLPLIEHLFRQQAEDESGVIAKEGLPWSDYALPPDLAGWVQWLASAAERLTTSFAISDMTLPLCPMVFVNSAFCRVTGYSKAEAHGRNCRFLQGPKTEPEAVATVMDAIRRGVDCHVKLTNYRKDGEMFQNLLSMRPVHDSNGVYRFCIGVQLEVTEASTTVEALSQLEQLLQLLPSTIEVAGRPVGPMHLQRVQTDSEPSSASTIALKLERALASKATAAPSGVLPRLVDCFANNHRDILKELGLEAKWENTKVDVITASSVRCDSEQSPGARKSRLARRKSRTSSDRSSGESSAVHGGGVAATRSTTPPKSIHRELREMLISSAADPQLQAMASSLGLQPPTGTGWLAQLGTLADQLPHAMIVVDMSLPGAKIDLVNSAFATLTGYSKAEAKGRNCKFLQGVKTEPTAIRRICRTIQREVQETLRVINYRANGSTFRNNLTLHPVHDCAGTCATARLELSRHLVRLG